MDQLGLFDNKGVGVLKQRLSWSRNVPRCYMMTLGIAWCLSLTCNVIWYPATARKHSSPQWPVMTLIVPVASLTDPLCDLASYRIPLRHSTSYGVPHHPRGIPCSRVWLGIPWYPIRWPATTHWGLLRPVATLALLQHDSSSLVLSWCDLISPWRSFFHNVTHHPTTSFAVLWQHACKDHIPYAWLYLVSI